MAWELLCVHIEMEMLHVCFVQRLRHSHGKRTRVILELRHRQDPQYELNGAEGGSSVTSANTWLCPTLTALGQ